MTVEIDDKELKSNGFIHTKQEGKLLARVRSVAGTMTSDDLRNIADIADKYGQGDVHMTTRQGIEMYGIDVEDYEVCKQAISNAKLNTGSVSATLKPIMCCPGEDYCKWALMNTRKTASAIDTSYFGTPVPAKVKIAVTGCPDSCAKPQINDIGFQGAMASSYDAAKCDGCGKCVSACKINAITLEDGKIYRDSNICVRCGRCVMACETGALHETKRGYLVYTGGRVGRRPLLGNVVREFVPQEDAVDTVRDIMATYNRLRQEGERIGETIKRVGLDTFRATLDEVSADAQLQ